MGADNFLFDVLFGWIDAVGGAVRVMAVLLDAILFCCYFLRRFFDVGQVEEVEKQGEVACIHQKRNDDVLIAHATRVAALLGLVHGYVDIDAEYHL